MRYFFILAAGALLAATGTALADPLDGIAVVVNDSPITIWQVEDGVAEVMVNMGKVISDPAILRQKRQEVWAEEVEQLEQHKMILNDFNNGGYVTNVLEAAIEDQVKEYIKDNHGGSRANLMKTLQAEGITYETFRKMQRERFIIRYMTYHHSDNQKIIISPLKIQNYYETHPDEFKVEDQVKLRMISLPAGTSRAVADEILRKIDSGVPFAEMAAVNSTGSSREKGGDRSWASRKDYNPELANVMFSLKAGQHSGVVELRNDRTGAPTYYILMVDEVRPARVSPLSEVQTAVEQMLKDQETKRLQDIWIKRLREKSHIETY